MFLGDAACLDGDHVSAGRADRKGRYHPVDDVLVGPLHAGFRRPLHRSSAARQPQREQEHLRALPTKIDLQSRYDNLKSAVSRVLFGRSRSESDRWVAFRSHMGFDAFYRQPGVDGAHKNGGVKGEGGRFRRTHLVHVPKVDSLAELDAQVAAADAADDHRRIANRVRTVRQDFAGVAPLLRPSPVEVIPTGLSSEPMVIGYARITVRQSTY